MVIGIITPYDSSNFGAYLQAFASKIYLESLGHRVYFIKWRKDETRRMLFFKKGNTLHSRLQYLQRYNFYKDNYEQFNKALNKFDIIDYVDLQKMKLDRIIVGSDEIWNIKVKNFQNTILYGDVPQGEGKVFAYAPSCGDSVLDDFDEWPQYKTLLKKINIIGVRDYGTQKLVSEIKENTPDIVCDPTLLCTINQYPIEEVTEYKKRYILIYSYNVPKQHIKTIKQFAKDKGLRLIAAGLYQNWCDENVACTPLQFIRLIQRAEFVYTTTFHGSIFTFLNHKNCAVYCSSQKVRDLILWAGMEQCAIYPNDSSDKVKKILSLNVDYQNFDEKVAERRILSRKFYERALEARNLDGNCM